MADDLEQLRAQVAVQARQIDELQDAVEALMSGYTRLAPLVERLRPIVERGTQASERNLQLTERLSELLDGDDANAEWRESLWSDGDDWT